MNILQMASNMKRNGPAMVVFDLAHGLAELGHTVYEGYNYEEDYVRAYSKEIDGSLYYIEIIANADTPKAISVYVS